MPGTFTYPGVYIEEIPSGVHAIAGVSTAETAFVDLFPRGRENEATRITSLAEFERVFGGVDSRSEASYAIQQYYLNGGQVAWVVRIAVGNPATASLTLDGGDPATDSLAVSASSPGAWGNNLEVAAITGAAAGRFDLFVRQVVVEAGRTRTVRAEEFRDLSIDSGDRRYVADTVNAGSALVELAKSAPDAPAPTTTDPTAAGGAPDDAFTPLSNGDDGTAFDADGSIAAPPGFATAVATGLQALERIDPFIFNILCLPVVARLGAQASTALTPAVGLCERRRAFLIVDIPPAVQTVDGMVDWMGANGGVGNHAAVYFPRVSVPDPLNEGRPRDVGPSGTMAGLFARTDAGRGVWKAPAGTEAALRGVALKAVLNDQDSATLNPIGVNVLRNLPIFGNVAWGARTLEGADQQASEWKYIPVRRTALYIEESLRQGLQWVVFEPNDEALWSQIRLNVGAFMQTLFRQGAFQGRTPREAYFVKCDKDTTTQADIDRGVVNILVGFAPLKPAEFVVIQIQQMAGQPQS